MIILDPPPCPRWCGVHLPGSAREWVTTPTAATRTCERRVIVVDGGERHEYVLQRFAALEFGALHTEQPVLRVDDGEAITLTHALHLAEALLRVVEMAGEPSLAA